MKNVCYLLLLLLTIGCQSEEQTPSTEETTITTEELVPAKIISLNGTITELLYEMNLGDQLVGIDITSTYPPATTQLSNLGHVSQLNAEAILALQPTAIFIDKKNEQNEVLDQIKAAGIPVHTIDIPYTLNGAVEAMEQLGELLQQEVNTANLRQKIATNQQKIEQLITKSGASPKVLFIYARGTQTLMVAGEKTFASAMIKIAGGTPAVQDFESFKPLTPEALLACNPDAILMFDSGLASLANEEEEQSAIEGLLSIKGMDKTPAGKNKNVIIMDGAYLSGFGPRASDAALELAQKIHSPSK